MKEYKKKLNELLEIIAEQDERKDLTYKEEEVKRLTKEVQELADQLPKDYFKVKRGE